MKYYHKSLNEADNNLRDYLYNPTSVVLLKNKLKYRLDQFSGLFEEDVKAFYLSGGIDV
jgi:hypothetical protein